MKCRICSSPLDRSGRCPTCGYEKAQDYEQYPTLAEIAPAPRPKAPPPRPKPKRRGLILALLAAALLLAGGFFAVLKLLPRSSPAAPAPTPTPEPTPSVYTRGTVSFTLEDEGKTLRISGTGAIGGHVTGGRYNSYIALDYDLSSVIPNWARVQNDITKLVIEEGIVGSSVDFSHCLSLQSVVLPGSFTDLPMDFFFDCTALSLVTFSEGLQEIGTNAFGNCSALTQLKLPDGVRVIDFSAFGH